MKARCPHGLLWYRRCDDCLYLDAAGLNYDVLAVHRAGARVTALVRPDEWAAERGFRDMLFTSIDKVARLPRRST